jgi:hypothetical protein
MNDVSINEILKNPELLNHDDCWSFYDWFCSEGSLEKRAKKFLPKLQFLVDQKLIDGDSHCVWFKNNMPVVGSIYDDMRISKLDDEGTYVMGLTPRTGFEMEDKCSVWVIRPEFQTFDFKDWSTLKKDLKSEDSKMRNLILTASA